MSQKLAKLFICTGLFFLVFGCIEGLMFPTKMPMKNFYSALFHIPPDMVKSFFAHFVAKIHTHVNLIGWVGSVLMGLLYFSAPKIAGQEEGQERYSAAAAYLNWGGHTLGLLMMVAGFHLIGHVGLSTGFSEGSEQFRQAVGPVKILVITGGTLITLSVLLFVYNILVTLFAPATAVAGERRRGFAASTVAGLLAISLILPVGSVKASPAKVKPKLPVIMIGDRLVDVTHSLGALPSAMSVRCSLWPLCDTLKGQVQVLGCPSCLLKKKAAPMFKFAKGHGITRVLIEKNDQFCTYMPDLALAKLGALAKEKGLAVEYVDFNKGLEAAVRQTAQLLDLQDRADPALEAYEKAMEKTRGFIAKKTFVKTVVILRGTYQTQTGKTFLRIEVPGGYADRFMLTPLGIKNLGHLAAPQGKSPSKGHVQIRKLTGLLEAAPDAIVMTGDARAVQKAIHRAVKRNPALAGIPALKNHALFSLPGYVDSSVMEYPGILKQWADLLSR